MSYDSARYCAKYLQKLNELDNLEPPFTLMSRKPGLGDPFGENVDLKTDKVYIPGGFYKKLPRYYLEKQPLEVQQSIKDKRQNVMNKYIESYSKTERFEESDLIDRKKEMKKLKISLTTYVLYSIF